MPKRVPSYRLHKPSNLAVVTIAGRDHYLGPFGSVESHTAYGELIAQNANCVQSVAVIHPQFGYSINEVVLAFLQHAKTHYRKDGKQTAE